MQPYIRQQSSQTQIKQKCFRKKIWGKCNSLLYQPGEVTSHVKFQCYLDRSSKHYGNILQLLCILCLICKANHRHASRHGSSDHSAKVWRKLIHQLYCYNHHRKKNRTISRVLIKNLQATANKVVCFRFPVHAIQCQTFH